VTTRPQLFVGRHLLGGLAAVGLLVMLLLAVATSEFGAPVGFPADASITANIGYALFALPIQTIPAESFLVALIVIAVALDVAIDGAVYLARREPAEEESGGER
jgi:NADH-quinone oxidoreductase subunit J